MLLDDKPIMTNAIVSSWYRCATFFHFICIRTLFTLFILSSSLPLRAVGVPVYRSSYAVLYVNEVWFGVYLITEDIDGAFLNSRFGDNDGNLYRSGKGRASMAYVTDDPTCVQERYFLFLFVECCVVIMRRSTVHMTRTESLSRALVSTNKRVATATGQTLLR